MFETVIITFREGLEMFLVIAIMFAYLAKTGRQDFQKPIIAGIVVAAIISLTTAWHIGELAEEPLWEGAFAMIAGVLVASMTYIVMRNAGNIRAEITNRMEQQLQKPSNMAAMGLFAFTVFMIAREGMETAMLLGAMVQNVGYGDIIIGGLIGFLLVGIIGYSWVKSSSAINLKLFMQVTGIFLILFCVQLFAVGLHEMTEIEAIPFVDNEYWHLSTEFIEEPIGKMLGLGILIVPACWILINHFMFSRQASK